uniref:F-box domain-containing protein n=1 Tax=Lactuca sativa TaxID=4236 RepID=A0A9R1X4C3_LACSA|nr:hypothetical protein LSAT_V11C700354270 [Lactuca sativa]
MSMTFFSCFYKMMTSASESSLATTEFRNSLEMPDELMRIIFRRLEDVEMLNNVRKKSIALLSGNGVDLCRRNIDEVTVNIFQRLHTAEMLNSSRKVCKTWLKICKYPAMWKVINMIQPPVYVWDLDFNTLEVLTKEAVDLSCWELIDISIREFCTDDHLYHIQSELHLLKPILKHKILKLLDRLTLSASPSRLAMCSARDLTIMPLPSRITCLSYAIWMCLILRLQIMESRPFLTAAPTFNP